MASRLTTSNQDSISAVQNNGFEFPNRENSRVATLFISKIVEYLKISFQKHSGRICAWKVFIMDSLYPSVHPVHNSRKHLSSKMIYASVAVLGLLASAYGKIYFKEDFNDKSWESRWTLSELKPKVFPHSLHHPQ